MSSSIKDIYAKFEAWVHSWFPGFKTRATAFLGAVSMFATSAYTYVTGLPATKYISQEALTLVAAGLFTLSFWFSNMGKRVEERKAE